MIANFLNFQSFCCLNGWVFILILCALMWACLPFSLSYDTLHKIIWFFLNHFLCNININNSFIHVHILQLIRIPWTGSNTTPSADPWLLCLLPSAYTTELLPSRPVGVLLPWISLRVWPGMIYTLLMYYIQNSIKMVICLYIYPNII